MVQDRYATLSEPFAAARSRRQVLGAAAKGTVGGLAAALAPSARGDDRFGPWRARGAAAQGPACPSAPGDFVRPNVYSLTEEQVASLRRGVAAMKGRPDSDPTSWIFQANLHALPALPELNIWCQHSSWFFFPWHRMYLYWFERILRAASGDANLMLPYWNYSDDPLHSFLPEAFRTVTDDDGNPNPLYEPRRNADINVGTTSLTPGAVDYAAAFSHTNFFVNGTGLSFGGQKVTLAVHNGPGPGELEVTPHGNVHVEIGNVDPVGTAIWGIRFNAPGTYDYECSLHPAMVGKVTVIDGSPAQPNQFVDIVDFAFAPQEVSVSTGTAVVWFNHGAVAHTVTSTTPGAPFDSGNLIAPGLMAMPKLAARDPIFWLHHANIDRLWNRWLDPAAGKINPPASETDWWDLKFPFYDESGAAVELSAGQVADAYSCLGYRYDDDPVPPSGTPEAAPPAEMAPPSVSREVTTLGETGPDETTELGTAPVTVAISLVDPAEDVIDRVVGAFGTPVAGGFEPQIVLSLEDIAYQGGPLSNYGIYVNLPANEASAVDYQSEYFVGNLYVFGLLMPGMHHGSGQGYRQDIDISRAVRTSQDRGEWQGDVAVSFVPGGAGASTAAEATPAGVEASPSAVVPAGPSITVKRLAVVAIE